MVSTRSKTAQTHIDDYATKDKDSAPKPKHQTQKPAPKSNTSKKRKSTSSGANEVEKPTPKRSKTTPKSTASTHAATSDPKIIINRAPVLHLWSACVAHAVDPNLPWSTCLSAGSAVSTICAVAKGRSIGTVPEKSEEKTSQRKKKDQIGEDVQVMQFHLKLKDGLAVVGSEGKGKPGGEEALRKKFGDKEYARTKEVFEEVLGNWEGEVEEVNKKAFGWYEAFRPDVSKGQKGWGRKGELDLEKVRRVVAA